MFYFGQIVGPILILMGCDEKLNTKVANACGFKMARVSRNPREYGAGLENYIRAKTKRIGVCVELSPPNDMVDQHPANMFKSLVWDKCKNMPILYLEELSMFIRGINIYLNNK